MVLVAIVAYTYKTRIKSRTRDLYFVFMTLIINMLLCSIFVQYSKRIFFYFFFNLLKHIRYLWLISCKYDHGNQDKISNNININNNKIKWKTMERQREICALQWNEWCWNVPLNCVIEYDIYDEWFFDAFVWRWLMENW